MPVMFDTAYQQSCLDTGNVSDDDYCPVCIDDECQCVIPSVIKVECRKCGRAIATIDEGEQTDDLCYKCAAPELYPAW